MAMTQFDFFDFDEGVLEDIDASVPNNSDFTITRCPQCQGQRRCADSFGHWNECGKCDGAGYIETRTKTKSNDDVPF